MVYIPPPTLIKSASSVPPKPKPNNTSGEEIPKIINIRVPPKRPNPSVSIPVTVPERYAIFNALLKLTRAAAATRTLLCTAIRIPNCPTISEKNAPIINAAARPTPIIMRT